MPKHIHIAATILALLIPSLASAATVKVEDLVAGLDVQITADDFEPYSTLELQVKDPTGTDLVLTGRTDERGHLFTHLPGELARNAGQYSITAMEPSSNHSASDTFRVLSDRLDPQVSELTVDRASVPADGSLPITAVVTLRDRYGNPLSGRPVTLIGSRSEDRIAPLTTETDSNGEMGFSIIGSGPGVITLGAMDLLTATVLQTRVAVTFGEQTGRGGWVPANGSALLAQIPGEQNDQAKFNISLTPEKADPDTTTWFDLQIEAIGSNGKRNLSYKQTPRISVDNDARADLPGKFEGTFGEIPFQEREQGLKLLRKSVRFSKPGKHVVTVEDMINGIRGSATVEIKEEVIAGQKRKIEILYPKPDVATKVARINATNVILKGVGPPLANLVVLEGEDETNRSTLARGETDANGKYEISVEFLDPNQSLYALVVQDENMAGSRLYTSEVLRIERNTKKPEFTFTFDPIEPITGTDVQLNVFATAEIDSVQASINTDTLTLTQDASNPLHYSVMFQAPEPGDYQPAITAKNPIGSTEIRGTLAVRDRDVAVPQNLQAIARPSGVDLMWDELPKSEGITKYTVYVGLAADDFSSTLDTNGAEVGAQIKGLQTDTEYFFAVTAWKKDRESAKSEIISTRSNGLNLRLLPTQSSIEVTWQYPADAPAVGQFKLEYWVDETEHYERMLTGELRKYTINDLLSDVSYSVRLTPIAITGEALTDIVATASTTTLNGSFKSGPSDPVYLPRPSNTNNTPPPSSLHQGAKNTPDSGVPMGAAAGAVALSLAVFYVYYRRRQQLAHVSDLVHGVFVD